MPVHHVLYQSLEELSGAVERLMAFSERKHGVTLLPKRSLKTLLYGSQQFALSSSLINVPEITRTCISQLEIKCMQAITPTMSKRNKVLSLALLKRFLNLFISHKRRSCDKMDIFVVF